MQLSNGNKKKIGRAKWLWSNWRPHVPATPKFVCCPPFPSSHVSLMCVHLNIFVNDFFFFEKGGEGKKRSVLNQHVTTLSNEFSLVYLLHRYFSTLVRAIEYRLDFFFIPTAACFSFFFLLFAWHLSCYIRFVYTCLSPFLFFCFGLFAVLFRDDDINTYI